MPNSEASPPRASPRFLSHGVVAVSSPHGEELPEEDVDRLKREYSKQQCELVNALSQLEYERSRANFIQAKVLHEEGVRWGEKFEAYKRQVDEQHRMERRMHANSRHAREVDESDLRADLDRERTLCRKKGERATAAEAEVSALILQIEAMSSENKLRESESLDAMKQRHSHAEALAQMKDRLALSQAEVVQLRQETSELRRLLRDKNSALASLERNFSSLVREGGGGGGGGGYLEVDDAGAGAGLNTSPTFAPFALHGLRLPGSSPVPSLPSVSPRSDGASRILRERDANPII